MLQHALTEFGDVTSNVPIIEMPKYGVKGEGDIFNVMNKLSVNLGSQLHVLDHA